MLDADEDVNVTLAMTARAVWKSTDWYLLSVCLSVCLSLSLSLSLRFNGHFPGGPGL